MNTAEKLLKSMFDNHAGLKANEFETIEFSHSFKSWDEVFSSNEYDRIWEGFQGKEGRAAIWKRTEFLGAWIVKTDPENNYGREFDLWVHYKTEGLIGFKKLKIHSSLTSQPMRVIEVYKDSALFTDVWLVKSPQGRAYAKQNKLTVST